MSDEPRVAVIIEDDADIRELLSTVLEAAGFRVVTAADGIDGVEAVRVNDPVITTLDVSMPGIDGFEAARRIRSFSNTYIVMLTARTDEIDTLQGLESGADDYITKPFRPRELRARIEAMLRRPRQNTATPTTASQSAADSGWIEHAGLRLHSGRHLVRRDDDDVTLTATEFDILEAIMTARGRVLSKADLASRLRGDVYGHDADDSEMRAIEVHMANLRRKLGESSTAPRWIETVRGVGYRLTAR